MRGVSLLQSLDDSQANDVSRTLLFFSCQKHVPSSSAYTPHPVPQSVLTLALAVSTHPLPTFIHTPASMAPQRTKRSKSERNQINEEASNTPDTVVTHSPSRFEKLPAEIKLLIYGFAIAEHESANAVIQLQKYGPGLLYVNREIRADATKMYYSQVRRYTIEQIQRVCDRQLTIAGHISHPT
jgi:hypothetical protein